MIKLKFAHCTDTGRVRTHNEDSVVVDAELGLALIADGMGGHNAGEVASKMAAKLISTLVAAYGATHGLAALHSAAKRQHLLRHAIQLANARIFSAAQKNAAYSGMGSTLALILFSQDQVTIAHIGDSRAYRLRDGKLEQLTQDHTLVQRQLRSGVLTNEHINKADNQHWLTRALGVMPEVAADMREEKLQADDRYLLCSDGLSDHVPMLKIQAILSQSDVTPSEQCRLLIAAANQHNGDDNISLIQVHVTEHRSYWLDSLARAKLLITSLQKGAKLPFAKY